MRSILRRKGRKNERSREDVGLWDKGYKIYLLSNYSDYLFNRHTEGKAFLDYIDGKVVSYEVHYTKPQKEIYEILLSKYKLKPEESLFFDDREENVQTAVSLGISGCVVKSREHINKELEKLINECNRE